MTSSRARVPLAENRAHLPPARQISHARGMRQNISVEVSAADRERNTPAKVVWRSKILLASADGLGHPGPGADSTASFVSKHSTMDMGETVLSTGPDSD
jgi:hypothetical protein